MKVIIAMDSFKGSLTSLEAGNAVRSGLLRAVPSATAVVKPVADGGEGTTQALVDALGAQLISLPVAGPYGDPVTAVYGLAEDRGLAVMEMAAAAGITLSPRRDPLHASSYGVGQMILDAIARGCREFIIGIGGSATNDGGIGMLTALGFRFLDRNGAECPHTAAGLRGIASIQREQVPPELGQCRFHIACDVTAPLCGESGCTYVFGPQKGVAQEQRQALDRDLAHFAAVVAAGTGRDFSQVPGAGAAGGLGFAFLSFLNGELKPGIQLVLSALRMDEVVRGADLVVTGEGCLDRQTPFGKTPAGVAACAKRHGIPVIAFAGGILPGAELCNSQGINAYFSILPRVMPLEEAMAPAVAFRNLEQTAEQVFRLIHALLPQEASSS